MGARTDKTKKLRTKRIMMNFTRRLMLAGLFAAAMSPMSAQLNGRHAAPAEQLATSVMNHSQNVKAKAFAPVLKQISDPKDYGKEVEIVSENFSNMTTGSEEAPDLDTDMNYENPDNVWINLTDTYTQTPGWGSGNAYPAGGTIYLNADSENMARLTTPMLDLSKNAGIAFISFKARVPSNVTGEPAVMLEGAETYNMSPTWDLLGTMNVPNLTTEWQTFTYMYYGCGSYTLFNLVAMNSPIIVDDVRVYQIEQTAPTPTAYKHKNYRRVDDATASFDIAWSKENADGYVLNIYETDDAGNITDYLRKDTELSDTTYHVGDAKTGTIYYYTVSSKKDGKTSIPCAAMQIKDVAEPELNVVSDGINEGVYKVQWKNVPGAERYNYLGYFKHVAEEDGTLDVANLRLKGMEYTNGGFVDFSTKDPDVHTYDRGYLADDIGQAGWTVTHYAVYKDALTLDGYWTTMGGSDAGLISPELDLSKDGGKFSVNLTACSNYQEYYDAYPQCAVALFNYDADKDDYVQSELVYAGNKTIDGSWKDYTCDFTTGSARSIIGIYAVWCPDNLYLSHVDVKQNYKAGEFFYDPFHYENWLAPTDDNQTELEVKVPYRACTHDIFHRAQSVRVGKEGSDYSDASFLTSAFSPLQSVGHAEIPAGVNSASVSLSGATVRLEGGNLVVNNPEKAPVAVYSVDGKLVASDNSLAESVKLAVPAHGTFVVKVGKQSVKLSF